MRRFLASFLVLLFAAAAHGQPTVGQSVTWSGTDVGPYGATNFSFSFTVTAVNVSSGIVYGNANINTSGGGGGYMNWKIGSQSAGDMGSGSKSFGYEGVDTIYIWYYAYAGTQKWATATMPWANVQKYVTVTIPANTSGVPVTWELVQEGGVIATFVQQPGSGALIQQVAVNSASPVTLNGKVVDLVNDGVTWTVSDGSVTPVQTFGPVTPSQTPGSATVGNSTQTPETPLPNSGPSDSPDTVWKNPTTSSPATDSTVKQASEKQTEMLRKIWDRQATTNAKLDQTNAKIDQGNATLEEIRDDVRKQTEVSERMEQIEQDNPTVGDMQSQGDAAANSEKALVPSPSGRSYSISGTSPSWSVPFFGRVIDANPFRSDRFGPVCAWFRSAMQWVCVIGFGIWCLRESQQMVQTLQSARQAHGNAIFSGTGAQATALIAAGLITASIGVALVAVFAFAGANFGAGNLLDAMGMDPFEGLPGMIAYALDQVFPLSAIAGYFVGRLVWGFAAQSAVVFFSALVRFIVP